MFDHDYEFEPTDLIYNEIDGFTVSPTQFIDQFTDFEDGYERAPDTFNWQDWLCETFVEN